eukprot:2831553-Pleurochrysis_carterae.AAC.5
MSKRLKAKIQLKLAVKVAQRTFARRLVDPRTAGAPQISTMTFLCSSSQRTSTSQFAIFNAYALWRSNTAAAKSKPLEA